ncbi:MAG: hypothetical protein ABFC77_15030 [Thermoguttaceae bacterium]
MQETKTLRAVAQRIAGSWSGTVLWVMATLATANLTLLVGIHSPVWDAADLGVPTFILLADTVRAGQWLLWTPLVAGGCPIGLEPGTGAFSPIAVGMAGLLGGSEFAFRIYWLTVWGLGGLGMVFLARSLAAPRWMAYCAAIGFMFSGFFTGHAQHTSLLYTASFLPWMIWRLDVAVRRRSWSAALQAGALCGLSGQGGYPGMVILSGCFAGFWMFLALLPRDHEDFAAPQKSSAAVWKKILLWLGLAAVFCATTFVVLAPSYLGFLVETQNYSDRSGALPRQVAVASNALHPRALWTAVSPYFMVIDRFQRATFPGTDPSTCCIYVFPLLLVLAIVGLVQRPREAFRWGVAALALFCLAAALGDWLPVRGWLYDVFPPMRYFRHSGMFRCYYIFCVIVLAIVAGRDLQTPGPRQNACWRRFAYLYAGAAALAVAGFLLFCWCNPPNASSQGYLLVGVVELLVVWPGIAATVFLGYRKGEPTRQHVLQKHLVRFALAEAILSIMVCKSLMFTNRTSQHWNQIEASHVAAVDDPRQNIVRAAASANGNQLRCFITKQPVFAGYLVLPNPYVTETANNPALMKTVSGADRCWFARQAVVVPLDRENFDRFAHRATAMSAPSLAVSSPLGPKAAEVEKLLERDGRTTEQPDRLEPRPANYLVRTSHVVEFEVVCPDSGWLLVTDRWANGWAASVNGRPTPMAIGNFLFRAIPVDQGLNRVRFEYHPFGYPWLLIASWSCLAVAVAVSIRIGRQSDASAPRSS